MTVSRRCVPLLIVATLGLTTVPPAAAERTPTRGGWPLRPRPAVVARFDPPGSPYGAGHRGVDLEGRPGQVVHSALPGRVSYAGRLAGRGVVVVVHGDTRTTYEPVAAAVAVGEPVAAGSTLGRLQLVGSHCFPRWCLHWGLIEGLRRYLDPLSLVGATPVRLLPLDGAAAGVRPLPLGVALGLTVVPRFGPVPLPGWGRDASGAGVGLPVRLAQPVGGDMGVDLRGGQ